MTKSLLEFKFGFKNTLWIFLWQNTWIKHYHMDRSSAFPQNLIHMEELSIYVRNVAYTWELAISRQFSHEYSEFTESLNPETMNTVQNWSISPTMLEARNYISTRSLSWPYGWWVPWELHLVTQQRLVGSVGTHAQRVFQRQMGGERGQALPEGANALLLHYFVAAIQDTCAKPHINVGYV